MKRLGGDSGAFDVDATEDVAQLTGDNLQRYAAVIKDGVIDKLFVEAKGEFKVSSAEYVLEQL